MEDVHRRAIQSNFVSLVEQTDLDLMVSALYEKGVFSEQMIERYKDTRNDVRSRKRQLYMDVMLRGPNAFGHLTDALQEAGYWNLARDLDPNSSLHILAPHINPKPPPITTGENQFISISSEKKKTKSDIETQKILDEARTQLNPVTSEEADPVDDIPHFHVKKSTKFMDDNGTDIKLYRTRGPRGRRGVLLVFSYIEFQHGMEQFRSGVDVDCKKLKYLFDEFGFTVLSYLNLTKEKTVQTLKSLNLVLAGAECAFIVVSSHGYRRLGSDADFRCHDGQLLSIYDFLEYFNNENLPGLVDIPKVFIFQICRGPNEEWHQLKMPTTSEEAGAWAGAGAGAGAVAGAVSDGAVPWSESSAPAPRPPARPRAPPPDDVRARLYSDILIAHSTLPGFVSRRDSKMGSWYIQVLCDVFAEHAHARHVEELFTLVDVELARSFRIQTSSVDRWGFNRRLYLHPGMYE